MTTNPHSDKKIIDSWNKNAAQWTAAVRGDQIESRTLVTNQAIINTVLAVSQKSVIDIGCGEGWLVRELSVRGLDVLGTDVIPGLIEQARTAGGGRFEILSYEDMAAGKLNEKFDTAVCNFSLIGKESVDGLFEIMPSLLTPNGTFIIQTMHPVISCDNLKYEDGWRTGTWTGFSSDFTDPAPWYFRKLETWVKLYSDAGFKIIQMQETTHPQKGKPVSVIFVGKLAG